MRDVHSFERSETTTTRQWHLNWRTWNWEWGGPDVKTFVGKGFDSARSDSISTQPVAGKYVTPTFYQAWKCSTSSSPGDVQFSNMYNPSVRKEWTGIFGPQSDHTWGLTPAFEPALPGSVINEARSRIRSGLESDLNVGVTVGEARESGKMIGQFLRNAFKALRGVRSAMLSAAAKGMSRSAQLKAASGAYLQVKYGILPLMSEIHSAAEALQGLADLPVGSVKVVIMDDSFGVPKTRYHYEFPTTPSETFSGTAVRGIEIAHFFSVENPNLFQLWQYGVTNPAVVAWELVTLSFVLDWFTGIGAWIGGLQQPLGLKHHSGYETHFCRADFVAKRDQVSPYGGPVIEAGSQWGTTTHHVRGSIRYPQSGFTGPKPFLDLGLNGSEAASLAALFIQRVT